MFGFVNITQDHLGLFVMYTTGTAQLFYILYSSSGNCSFRRMLMKFHAPEHSVWTIWQSHKSLPTQIIKHVGCIPQWCSLPFYKQELQSHKKCLESVGDLCNLNQTPVVEPDDFTLFVACICAKGLAANQSVQMLVKGPDTDYCISL